MQNKGIRARTRGRRPRARTRGRRPRVRAGTRADNGSRGIDVDAGQRTGRAAPATAAGVVPAAAGAARERSCQSWLIQYPSIDAATPTLA